MGKSAQKLNTVAGFSSKVINYLETAKMSLCCFIFYDVLAINIDLRKIVLEECRQWKCNVSLDRHYTCYQVAKSPATMSFNENCRVLEHSFADSTDPVWPPSGYNLILKINSTRIRDHWPQSTNAAAAQAVMAGMVPVQLAMPQE